MAKALRLTNSGQHPADTFGTSSALFYNVNDLIIV
ncbi:hypothetical protein DFR27_0645 [Umboniibacter marinipuniceus]|uniref:Uncharacterized protein n=1 Tax=Umboniibacter marinipuniceus TaxID=569599 RepID=A0A3M0ACM1_9GAMM|nr:hypothetical protein DFR27_0627 [Umboniibacter marinipuniceus]RMA82690.1 hypothetical protein DFR27_0645 [Umboniibacter marinipuniceus]